LAPDFTSFPARNLTAAGYQAACWLRILKLDDEMLVESTSFLVDLWSLPNLRDLGLCDPKVLKEHMAEPEKEGHM